MKSYEKLLTSSSFSFFLAFSNNVALFTPFPLFRFLYCDVYILRMPDLAVTHSTSASSTNNGFGITH
jgi:hypothetical protein